MQWLATNVCHRCRMSVLRGQLPASWLDKTIIIEQRRYRSGTSKSRRTRDLPKYDAYLSEAHQGGDAAALRPTNPSGANLTYFVTRIADPTAFFIQNVERWSHSTRVHSRLEHLGVDPYNTKPLLQAFAEQVKAGKLTETKELVDMYNLGRLQDPIPQYGVLGLGDHVYTNVLYHWASLPSTWESVLKGRVAYSTVLGIRALHEAGNYAYPADEYLQARSVKRKVIMHVGPTNSGKTHNALRALAASSRGTYAGPLRLLAHEIWERFNLGQIVPKGVDTTSSVAASASVDEETSLDVPMHDGKSPLRKFGTPKYVRECNLITGEEQKIVNDNATMTSCTVEMVSVGIQWDVAVIDEIQLIGDPERGHAWTRAFLGLMANELHLCGEESAVPLIKELAKDTGDEVEVHYYERLTPLHVAEKSLGGDLKKIEKGDCIVTFSRKNIFALKKRVEAQTGMRCAVAYGLLPPEIRSEQAALFNDPDSGYDVIIGSDAIGMGLNLKIKRVVFHSLKKWNGTDEVSLPVSLVKQIAGRAGRYGMHGKDDAEGLVLTIHENDMGTLRKSMAAPNPPLRHAYLAQTHYLIERIIEALPRDASTRAIYEVSSYISYMRPLYRMAVNRRLVDICAFIDSLGRNKFTLHDCVQVLNAPIQWRNLSHVRTVARMWQMYIEDISVSVLGMFRDSEMLHALEDAENSRESGIGMEVTTGTLSQLENLHKLLVLYLWLAHRSPIAYHDADAASVLKIRTEDAMDWVLRQLSLKELLEESGEDAMGQYTQGEVDDERLRRFREERRQAIPWVSRRDVKLSQAKETSVDVHGREIARQIYRPERVSSSA